MKTKVYFSVLFGAVSMLSLTACSSDDNESVDNNIIRISTQIANGPDASATRAGAAIQSTAFENGETIKIYAVDNTSTTTKIIDNAVYTQGSGFASNYYYPANGHTINIYGMYPSTVAYETTSFSVNADQSTAANYKASDLMSASIIGAARQSGAQSLVFSHQLSKIIVQVKKAASIVADNESAALTLKSVKTGATITSGGVFSVATGSAGTVTVGTASNLTTSYQSVAAIIPPQTIAGESDFIQLVLGSGGSYTYKIPAGDGVTFAGGKVYTYSIEVGLYGITVSTSINDWDSNTTPVEITETI